MRAPTQTASLPVRDNPPERQPVLLVPSVSEPSGVVTYIAALVQALSPIPCAVVAKPGSALARELPDGCELVAAGGGRLSMSTTLARRHRSYGFVQAHGPRALLAARLALIPHARLGYVFHELGSRHSTIELRMARGLHVAGNSRATAQWAAEHLGTATAALPPIVSAATAAVDQAEARRALGVSSEQPVIGVIGRLSAVKEPLLAVEAVARMRTGCTLVFVGEGPERPEIVARARTLGVSIHLAGSVPGAATLVTAFDIVLSCSRVETFGLAAAEAIVAGTPLVAVDAPGPRELSDGGRLLDLVVPDPGVIASALERVLLEPTAEPELRHYVLSQFGSETAAERLRAYYLALTGRRA